SMAAFKANRLVCSAIFSIISNIWFILLELMVIFIKEALTLWVLSFILFIWLITLSILSLPILVLSYTFLLLFSVPSIWLDTYSICSAISSIAEVIFNISSS